MELNLQRILSKLCLKWAEKLIRGVDIAAWNKTFMEGITDKSATWEREVFQQ